MQDTGFNRLVRIDHLIRIKGTGSPGELGQKLGLSKRTILNYIRFMKEQGAPIKFCPFRESYFYEEEGFFFVSCKFVRKEPDSKN